MKTWKIEAMIVLVFTLIQLTAVGWSLTNGMCSLAVMLTFMHMQIADRMHERQQVMDLPTVPCYWKLNYYFIAKESTWISFFIITKSYPAIFGCVLFILYPIWRKYWRSINPLI